MFLKGKTTKSIREPEGTDTHEPTESRWLPSWQHISSFSRIKTEF